MLKWVEPFMWGVCRVLAFILQLVGCAGIMLFVLIGLWALTDYINQM